MIDFAPNLRAPQAQIRTALPYDVLAVDDDELTRTYLMSLLSDAGYRVQGAGTGAEALSLLSKTPCRIVITDWQMPDMDGLELYRALKLGAATRPTYVLMLTVRSDASDILAGLEAGVDDYVVKGATENELLARMAAARSVTRVQHSARIAKAESNRLSIPDSLTGAQTRRFLTKYLPLEIDRSRRLGLPTAVLSCDIDEMTRINFRFGHKAGDSVLRAFVARTKGCTRGSVDQIVRVGGDEFFIILPETTLDVARIAAEAISSTFSNEAIATSSGPVRTTVSIGATAMETPEDHADFLVEELLRAADQCLYLSKAGSRGLSTCLPLAAAALLMRPGDLNFPPDIN